MTSSAVDVSRGPATGGAGEGDSAPGLVFGAERRIALDVGGAARGADEGFAVPISDNQDQGFRCAIFLDSATSHGLLPFQAARVKVNRPPDAI